MTNNKKIKIVVSMMIFASFFLVAPKTFALKKAIFPDGKSLQPMPQGVTANISGNINSTTEIPPTAPTEQVQTENNNITATPTSAPENKKSFVFYLTWSVIALITALVIFWIYNKAKDEQHWVK